jgi:hypothetical protein
VSGTPGTGVVEEALIVTLGDTELFTLTPTLFEVAILSDGQTAFDFIVTVIVSLLFKAVVE